MSSQKNAAYGKNMHYPVPTNFLTQTHLKTNTDVPYQAEAVLAGTQARSGHNPQYRRKAIGAIDWYY